MYIRYFFFFLALLLHSELVSAENKIASEPVVYQALAAHYQETHRVAGGHKESTDWYFSRQNNQVETARGSYAEVWQRDDRGELTLTRVFHQDRKLVQYTPGELRTEGRLQEWSALNSIIDPRQLTSLKQNGTVTILGKTASRYTGKFGEDRVEVLWLPKESLVAKLVRTKSNTTTILELKELRASSDAHWPQASLDKSEGYTYIDGSDLGDMEYDPFVQRLLEVDGGHDGHGHHAH